MQISRVTLYDGESPALVVIELRHHHSRRQHNSQQAIDHTLPKLFCYSPIAWKGEDSSDTSQVVVSTLVGSESSQQ